MKAIVMISLLGLAVWSEAASAQVSGARELPAAGQLQGAAGTAATADLYYLAGEMGARETYQLTIKGEAALTLFSREGEEILSVEGSGTIKLEAVLPYTDIYSIAISRKTPGQIYTLTRRATVPTLAEAALAEGVGFEGSYRDKNDTEIAFHRCWIVPGVKVRMTYPTIVEEMTLAADRATILWTGKKATGTTSGDATYAIDGADIVRSVRPSNAKPYQSRYPYDPIPETRNIRKFEAYSCPDGPAG